MIYMGLLCGQLLPTKARYPALQNILKIQLYGSNRNVGECMDWNIPTQWLSAKPGGSTPLNRSALGGALDVALCGLRVTSDHLATFV